MISIFDYTDHRKFIQDFQAAKHAMNPAFSFRYLSRKAGINSSSFYPQIISGLRNLTRNTVLKTCVAFNLREHESGYFEAMVFYNQAKTVKERSLYFEKLMERQKFRDVRKVGTDQFDYFSAWYHCIIREAVTIVDWRNDYKLLAKYLHPAITAQQARASVELLIRLGFLKIENGRYAATEPLLASDVDSDFKAHAIMNLQIQMLNIAIEAYHRWKPGNCLTSATTIGIAKANYAKYVDILRECRQRLMKLAVDESVADQVYTLSMNFFPVTLQRDAGQP